MVIVPNHIPVRNLDQAEFLLFKKELPAIIQVDDSTLKEIIQDAKNNIERIFRFNQDTYIDFITMVCGSCDMTLENAFSKDFKINRSNSKVFNNERLIQNKYLFEHNIINENETKENKQEEIKQEGKQEIKQEGKQQSQYDLKKQQTNTETNRQKIQELIEKQLLNQLNVDKYLHIYNWVTNPLFLGTLILKPTIYSAINNAFLQVKLGCPAFSNLKDYLVFVNSEDRSNTQLFALLVAKNIAKIKYDFPTRGTYRDTNVKIAIDMESILEVFRKKYVYNDADNRIYNINETKKK